MKRLREWKEERGSVTIEASISMIGFTFLIVSILLFINVGRAQMAIQTSINKSAQEIAQYMYLYKVSGLYDLDVTIQAAGKDAEGKMSSAMTSLDSIVSGYETVVGNIAGGGSGSNGSAQNLDGYVEQLKTVVQSGKDADANLKTQSTEIKEIIKAVKDNPAAFLKSLAALGVSKAMDETKSFLVGSLLGAALTEKYLDTPYMDADSRLKALHVKDGMDGLDFSKSSIFSSSAGSAGKERDINLVVVYRVKVFTLFSHDLTVPFAQSASVQAWLGGDAEIDVLKQAVIAATPEEEPTTETTPEEEPTTETAPEEEEPTTETTPEEEEPTTETEPEEEEPTTETESEEEEPEGSNWNSAEGRRYILNREKEYAMSMGMYDINYFGNEYYGYTEYETGAYYDESLNQFNVILPLDMTQERFADGGNTLSLTSANIFNVMKEQYKGDVQVISQDSEEKTITVAEGTRFHISIIVPEGSKPDAEYIEYVENLIFISYGPNYTISIAEGYGTK